jgi:hypothetical protein
MTTVDIPSQYREIIPLNAGETVTCNGYRGTRSEDTVIRKQKISLFRMKGDIGSGRFLVLYDPSRQEWYKVAGTSGLVKSIEQEKLGVTKSLELNQLQALAKQIQMLEVLISNVTLPALRSPHLGPTIEFLNKENQDDKSFRLWLFSVYESAFQHALELFKGFEIWFEDPNPGNIVLHPNSDSCSDACLVLIDFSSKKRRKMLAPENENLLYEKFAQQAEMLMSR